MPLRLGLFRLYVRSLPDSAAARSRALSTRAVRAICAATPKPEIA